MGIVDKFGVEGWTGVVVELVVVFSLATTSVGRRLRCITPVNFKKSKNFFRKLNGMLNWRQLIFVSQGGEKRKFQQDRSLRKSFALEFSLSHRGEHNVFRVCTKIRFFSRYKYENKSVKLY